MHVTSEIVNDIHHLIQHSRITIEALQRLDFRLSKPVYIIPVPYPSSRRVEGVDADGVLERDQPNVFPSSEIPMTVKGTLRTIDPEIIVVLFKKAGAEESDEGIPLKFKRNSQGRYDLFSAELGVETASLYYEGRTPQLLVIDRPPELNDRLDMHAAPYSAPVVVQQPDIYYQPQPEYHDGGQSYDRNDADRGPYADQFGQSRNVSDSGCSTQRGIIEYIRHQNPYVNQEILISLIEIYIHEAEIEGINHDIAIAQMLYATNFLGNQRIATHNYVGLSPTTGWDGSFYDMATGVRAHIQHIKGYASRHPPRTYIVDPRYYILADLGYLGTVITFDDLYGRWTANPNYGNSIEGILQGMYQFSAGYEQW